MVLAECDIASADSASGSLTGPPFLYRAFDLHLHSDVELPLAKEVPDSLDAPHIVIRRVEQHGPPVPDGQVVMTLPCPVHGSDMIEHRGPGGTWIWMRSVGTFHISLHGRQVDVYPVAEVDERVLGLALFGPILLFVRHMLGSPTLHASAVIVRHLAVAFLGVRGHGISTMAASFLRRGATLLSDDALPLTMHGDDVHAVPGPPFIKLWRETVEQSLELQDDLPNLMTYVEKKLLALEGRCYCTEVSTRLHALYLLDRYDPEETGQTTVVVRTLCPREALLALLTHTYSRPFMRPSEDAMSLPVYSRLVARTPVRILSYPRGPGYQDLVHSRILQDLELL